MGSVGLVAALVVPSLNACVVPPSASPLLGLGFCGDSFCSAGSESRVVGWGGQN
jgi:hypothetical protein